MTAYIRAVLDLTPNLSNYIEAVHRISNIGAVVSHAAHGTSQAGFEAEWRVIDVLMFAGSRINRLEVFDESDLDAAVVRFEELHERAPRLENAASQVVERLKECFTVRDWDAIAGMLADGVSSEDRRRVVNSGFRHGRDAVIAEFSDVADFVANRTSDVLATRGARIVLSKARVSGRDERPEAFHTEVLDVVEIDTDGRVMARSLFDPDDVEAAFEELDARYLAGEAAPYSRTWSLLTQTHATLNRHEMHPITPDWVNIDNRRGLAFAPGDIVRVARDTFDDMPDATFHIVAVHRLSDLGGVITQAIHGTSRKGLEAEWQHIALYTFEGDLVNRCEIFDEADLDAALARFDELRPQAPRLANMASQVDQHFWAYFAARDWDAMAETTADAMCVDDRRRVVNAGVRHGRDAQIANLRAMADVGITKITSTVIAIRGERLALTRLSNRGLRHAQFGVELLAVVEIDADNKLAAHIAFDPDDVDAAFAELDARYAAGEAAAYASTWSVIEGIQTAVNRREVPAMIPDPGYIDHRPLVSIEGADLAASIRAIFEIHSTYSVYVEAVHRLDELGAVYTQVHSGTSHDGVDAEWRIIEVQTVDGDLLSRAEVFDEADLDPAFARFDELHRAQRLENAALRIIKRSQACFVARDWDALAELIVEDFSTDDRRRVVSAGQRHGRDAEIENNRAIADLGITKITSTVIAIRGERLILTRTRYWGRDEGPEAFLTDLLGVVEINTGEQIAAVVAFDLDDIDAAFAELDARYAMGDGSPHAHTWSLMAQSYAALNRH
jgi:hypothetical protein